jgi:mono/diheme cytochrome c family protein
MEKYMQASLVKSLIAVTLLVSLTHITVIQAEVDNQLENPQAATTESVAAGEKIYKRYCQLCHGENGTGSPSREAGFPASSNLVDSEWDHGSTDGDIYTVIENGVEPEMAMEPWFDRLSETDMWNVVNYLRALAKQ